MLTAKTLKNILSNMNDSAPVYVGCQGYTNYTPDEPQNCDTKAFMSQGRLFITDACKIDGIDEDKPEATNLQLGLEMILRIKFNREIKDTDYIGIGSITLEMDGEDLQFDFEKTAIVADYRDKSMKGYWAESLDFDTFPDCYKITHNGLKKITKVKEIFIQLDSENKDDILMPVGIKTLTFNTTYNDTDESKWESFAVKEEVLKTAEFCIDGV